MPLTSVIIVSWNVRDLLLRCLANLRQEAEGTEVEIIVVDNASQDGTVAAVRAGFPEVQVIANQENRGFTGGNNQGLAVARGEYFFLLNPDTEVRPGALLELRRYLETHPQVGILGPRLRYADGSIQPSRRRFPTLLTLFTESTIVQEAWPGLPWFGRFYLADRSPEETQAVDWVVGAAMFVRRQVYEQVGGLDEGFFMYSEELDWCRRAAAAGWQVIYHPAAEVMHYEGRSSEQVVAARHIHFFSSRVRYTRNYHGRLAAGCLRAWLLATFVWQWLREAAKWLLGHKRDLRRRRMAAYRQVLASRLR
ncbi:MAG: glycosyltransferase family 2 protein [Caldilineales bacterium]|nr:glycosyltransferase family 2 protein [Caldilineales bacterium]